MSQMQEQSLVEGPNVVVSVLELQVPLHRSGLDLVEASQSCHMPMSFLSIQKSVPFGKSNKSLLHLDLLKRLEIRLQMKELVGDIVELSKKRLRHVDRKNESDKRVLSELQLDQLQRWCGHVISQRYPYLLLNELGLIAVLASLLSRSRNAMPQDIRVSSFSLKI